MDDFNMQIQKKHAEQIAVGGFGFGNPIIQRFVQPRYAFRGKKKNYIQQVQREQEHQQKKQSLLLFKISECEHAEQKSQHENGGNIITKQ